jgi:hypothetical protein
MQFYLFENTCDYGQTGDELEVMNSGASVNISCLTPLHIFFFCLVGQIRSSFRNTIYCFTLLSTFFEVFPTILLVINLNISKVL